MPTVMIAGKKHTPSSGTLKKMKAKAALEAASAKAKPKAAAKAATSTPAAKVKKAPVPAEMSVPMRMKRQTAGVATSAYGRNGYKTGGSFSKGGKVC